MISFLDINYVVIVYRLSLIDCNKLKLLSQIYHEWFRK
jgi:hypothetical protein